MLNDTLCCRGIADIIKLFAEDKRCEVSSNEIILGSDLIIILSLPKQN